MWWSAGTTCPIPLRIIIYTIQTGDGEGDLFDARVAGRDCVDAADADVFFPDFDGIHRVFNLNYDPAASQGFPTWLTNDGQEQENNGSGRRYASTLLPAWTHEKQDTWAHEMGHGFGLPHSSGPYDATYDSQWDVMSGGQSLVPYPGYGYLGVHTIAYHKDGLGWIPADRKYVAPPDTTRTITLERLAEPGPDGYLMAEIPIGDSDTDFYTVEARLFAGYDEEIPGEAVVIHKVDTTGYTRRDIRVAQVVDVDNNGNPNDEGAMWTPGEIFTDLANGIEVSVDAARSTSFQVTIAHTVCADSLSSTRQFFAGRGGSSGVGVKGSEGCSWAAVSNSSWIRITAGSSGSGNGSVSYSVAANPNPTARTGTLSIGGWTFTVTQASANDNLFEDDMENGTVGWSVNSLWALTTAASRSGTNAWTDSPGGNYQNNLNANFITSPIIDLTGVTSATLTFWHRYDIASGDYADVIVGGVAGGFQSLRPFTGTNPDWEQVSIDLTPFVGSPIRLYFGLYSDASETADGWYIDDVAVFSPDLVTPEPPEPPPPPQARLENPALESSQSGIGIISGWACEAGEIVIELDGSPVPAAYGTPRGDTRSVCGDSNNGFSLLVNWSNLGAGEHTIRALVDGVEFARTTVRVTTFGVDFLRGVSGTFDLPNFPSAGATTVIQWEESQQNFVITAGQPGTGGGHSRVAGLSAVLENPSLGSSQSGIGIISGWACEAGEIVIELAGSPVPAAYGTLRGDTRRVCGDSNNGFSLLVNWSNLGAGEHTIRALVDGVEFARTTVRVTTFGVDFLRGVSGTFDLPNFPSAGATTVIQWEESLQNFVIIPY